MLGRNKKTCKKRKLVKTGSCIIRNSWKHLHKENQTFKQPSALLVKELVDKHGQLKTVIQIKSRFRNFKGFFSTIDNLS